MKHLFSILLLTILPCLPLTHPQPGQKESALVAFGAKEEIDAIQNIEGTDYKLSHKYTLYFFIAGVWVSDDGYVLQKKDAFNTYYPLSADEVKNFQAQGKLPSPLPKYSIPLLQYLFGYSLWIIVAFVAGGPFLRHLSRRLMGRRFCPSCKLELTPYEAEMKVCGICHTHL
jgi:hypothetical protein